MKRSVKRPVNGVRRVWVEVLERRLLLASEGPFPQLFGSTFGTLSASAGTGTGVAAGDSRTYTLDLEGGQSLSAYFEHKYGVARTLRARLEFTAPDGELIVAADSPGVGEWVGFSLAGVPVTGTYRLTLSGLDGTAGTGHLFAWTGATLEAEGFAGRPANGELSGAEDLDGAFMAVPGAAWSSRAVVMGRIKTTNDVDWYKVHLEADETVSLGVGFGYGITLEASLLDANGVELARGHSTYENLGMVHDFRVAHGGDYYVRVTGPRTVDDTDYELFVFRNASLHAGQRQYVPPQVGGRQAHAGYVGWLAGYPQAGDQPDRYQVWVRGGEALTLTTLTPFDAAGGPANRLDPVIDVLDESGAVVVSDNNSGADGKNARLTYVPAADGVVVVRVSSAAPATSWGEYVLLVDGARAEPEPFSAWSSVPGQGMTVGSAPREITVTFLDSVYLPSVGAADLTVDGQAATGVSVVAANVLRYTLPLLEAPGEHTVRLGAGSVTSVKGLAVNGFETTYVIDRVPPRVIGFTPGPVVPADQSVQMSVEFDDWMRSANGAAFSLTSLVPGTTVPAPDDYDWAGPRFYLYYRLPEGRYSLKLFSGNEKFEDQWGNDLDGEANATFPSGDGTAGGDFVYQFDADPAGPKDLDPFFAGLPPSGSGVHGNAAGSADSFIYGGADVDAFTFTLEAGAGVTVQLAAGSTLRPRLELVGPDGQTVAVAEGSAAGRGAVIEWSAAVVGGRYTLRARALDDTFGTSSVRVRVNAAGEAESGSGPDNGSAATAEDLDGRLVSPWGATGASRAAVRGVLSVRGEEDWYRLTLSPGESVAAAARGEGSAGFQLDLVDGEGRLVTRGGTGDRSISDYRSAAGGTYFLKVSGSAQDDVAYVLVAGRNTGIEVEPNTTAAQATAVRSSAVGGRRWYLGTTSTGSGGADLYKMWLDAGDIVTLRTATPFDGAGLPNTAPNLRLRLLNAASAAVASDDNSASDGRNAILTYTAAAAGMYYAEVSLSSGAGGDYVLELEGVKPPPVSLAVTSVLPADQAKIRQWLSSSRVVFSHPLDLRTVSASDILIDGEPVGSLHLTGSDFISITPAGPLSEGVHTLTIPAGAVAEIGGEVNQSAFTSTFTFDSVAPRVVESSIQRGDVLRPGDLTITIRFSEPMLRTNSIPAGQRLRALGAGVNRALASSSYDATGTVITLRYNGLPADRYSFSLISGPTRFEDPTGNALDGEAVWPIPPNESGNGLAGGDFIVAFEVVTRLEGDANGDGVVDHVDFGVMRSNFGKSGKTWADGDFNGDGVVNFSDFQIMERRFGKRILGGPAGGEGVASPAQAGLPARAPATVYRAPGGTFATAPMPRRKPAARADALLA